MKKEPTIKNVLAELEHIEVRLLDLEKKIIEEYTSNKDWMEVSNYVSGSALALMKSNALVLLMVKSKMLKDAK